MTLSTHVLDTSEGRPAAGLSVNLYDAAGAAIGDGVTDGDGRVGRIGPDPLPAGDYRLEFDTGGYHDGAGFYPRVSIWFTVSDPGQHYHVPLLLNPFGYATYRGS
jgi:5-hydroxyisourate hydrolase